MAEVPGLNRTQYPELDNGNIRVNPDGRFQTDDEYSKNHASTDREYDNVLAMAVPLGDFNREFQTMLEKARNIGWGDSDDEVAGNISPLYGAVDDALENIVLGEEEIRSSLNNLTKRLEDPIFIDALTDEETTPQQIVTFVETGSMSDSRRDRSWLEGAKANYAAYNGVG